MKATFENSVNVLVKSYLNGTLAHRICTACAVGNLVADAMGGKKLLIDPHTAFNNVEYSDGYRVQWPFFSNLFPCAGSPSAAKYEIEKTGYTTDEIARIEIAFEECEKPQQVIDMDAKCVRGADYYTNDQWMFNGLMAVVDVLAEIHNIDLTAKESAKKLFVKP